MANEELLEWIASLEISFGASVKAIACPCTFFSAYDLQSSEYDSNIHERLTANQLSGSSEGVVIRTLTVGCLREIAMPTA